MTRFAAYSSESSSEEEEVKPQTPTVFFRGRSQLPNDDADQDDGDDDSDSEESESSSSSGSEPSEMQEDELITSPPRRHGKVKGKNALVEDENGDMRYAHEIDKRVSPGSASSRSSPGSRVHTGSRGDPSIIPWAQQIGVDSQRMHVMQASLFRNQEETTAIKTITEPVNPKGPAVRLENNAKTTSRKHRRDSDGDAMRFDSRERPSFAHDIEPPVFRPSRKYARVNIKSSIVKGSEAAYSDAGLSMGRSFRVAWGPGGQLVYLGSLCSPSSTSHISANSSVVTIKKVLPSPSKNRQLEIGSTSSSSTNTASIAAKLLQHHLSHTMISQDEAHVPRANPQLPPPLSSLSQNTSHFSSSSQEPLNFASFISLFPSPDASSPSSIFRLGSALFDSTDLRLGLSKSNSFSHDVQNRVQILRRKASLSKWLEEVVKHAVDGDLRVEASGSNAKYTPADAAFSHLTGHQINEACTKASAGGYFKLATLISQAGGDDLFKQDIQSQLEIWKSEKLAPSSNNNLTSTHIGLVGRGVWRIYNLLAGLVGQDEERNRPEDDVCAGLDWKRVFGLCLWYGSSVDSSVADVVKTYEGMILRNSRVASGVARPIPKWVIEKKKREPQLPSSGPSRLGLFQSSSSTMSSEDLPEDPLFALIKLHADPALSLSKALNPYSFSPAGVDLGVAMCWHLYIILSRVMRVRDFSDRTLLPLQRNKYRKRHNGLINGINHDGNAKDIASDDDHSVDDDGDEEHRTRPEGHSPTADLLTSTYALELESWGLLQEAVFVLLHLEGTVGREKAIKDLLARSGDKLDDWMSRGLIGSLKLPATWIDEAKAIYELDCGNVYAAYELYITAQQYNAAHNIAVLELAPDAVIRKDLELLCNLFNPLATTGRREKIDGWFVRGQVFLDYARIMTRLPRLLDAVAADDEEDALPDASQTEEIEDLTKTVPKIIAILPDVLHRSRFMDARHPAALEEMTKDLLKLVERAKPMLLTQIQQSRLSILDGASRINLVKGIGYVRFLQSIEV